MLVELFFFLNVAMYHHFFLPGQVVGCEQLLSPEQDLVFSGMQLGMAGLPNQWRDRTLMTTG